MSAFDLSEQEKPMIKSVPEQEIINSLLGNVKMAGAGLLKLEQKDKAEKKEKRKEAEKKERNAWTKWSSSDKFPYSYYLALFLSDISICISGCQLNHDLVQFVASCAWLSLTPLNKL